MSNIILLIKLLQFFSLMLIFNKFFPDVPSEWLTPRVWDPDCLKNLKGYIDVGDGCWKPNVLVTRFGCW